MSEEETVTALAIVVMLMIVVLVTMWYYGMLCPTAQEVADVSALWSWDSPSSSPASPPARGSARVSAPLPSHPHAPRPRMTRCGPDRSQSWTTLGMGSHCGPMQRVQWTTM